MRTIGLSHSVAGKLARFLVDLFAGHDEGKDGVRLTLFGEFKRKQLLQVKSSMIIIKNEAGLESVGS
jgi:hypothetical protein